MEIGFLKKIVVCFLISYIALGCQSNDELNWNQEQGYRWAEVTPGFWDETGF